MFSVHLLKTVQVKNLTVSINCGIAKVLLSHISYWTTNTLYLGAFWTITNAILSCVPWWFDRELKWSYQTSISRLVQVKKYSIKKELLLCNVLWNRLHPVSFKSNMKSDCSFLFSSPIIKTQLWIKLKHKDWTFEWILMINIPILSC